MTKNANQTLSSPSRQLRLSLTNDERMLLFWLVGKLHTLLSDAEFVLGFSDLEDRQRVVSGLFQRLARQNDILLNEQEEYEVYIALGGLPYFSDNLEMLEHDKALAASIRAKLLAAESAPAEPAPAEPAPAEPAPAEPAPAESAPVESSPAEPAPAKPEFAFSPRESAIISHEIGGVRCPMPWRCRHEGIC